MWLLDVSAIASERVPLGRLHGQGDSSVPNQQAIVHDRRAFACGHLTSSKALSSSTHTPEERDTSRCGHIIEALKAAAGKISGQGGAAERLGLRRTTLQSKMRKLGIAPLPRDA